MHDYNEDEPFISKVEVKLNEIEKDDKRKKNRNNLNQAITLLLIFIIFYFLVPEFILERFPVDGTSMEASLHDGESVFVDKISKKIGSIKRFDVIVFYIGDKEANNYYIKRVIGLPGERIQIIDDIIYIDNNPLYENYGKNETDYSGLAENELIIGPDEYFVLGDNRKISLDSRYENVGMVADKQIIGRAFMRVWPINRIGFIK